MTSDNEQLHATLTLDRARQYVIRGFSVIPLQPNDKRPATLWKEYQDRLPTDLELVSWFGATHNNIGIVTGSVSGIDVLDCDSPEAVQLAHKNGLPAGPIVRTARGYHFYFAHVPGVSNFQKRPDLPGIDLRGEGGYVVAPPSIHPSGEQYRWEDENLPLVPLPAWAVNSPAALNHASKTPLVSLYGGAGEGSRNDSLTRLVGSWASTMPEGDVLNAALWWGTSRCSPRMDEDEIERTVRSICSRQATKGVAALGLVFRKANPDWLKTVDSLSEGVNDLYNFGMPKGLSTGWTSVDELFTVRKGEWTVVTGVPGSGKSTWVDQLALNVASLHNWRFAVFSAENLPYEQHVARLMEKFTGRGFDLGSQRRMTTQDFARALDFVGRHFVYITPPEDDVTLSALLAAAKLAVERDGIDALVIDPWNELDHSRASSVTETEYISAALTEIRRFARANHIHVIVVAHPTKISRDKDGLYPVPTLYDIAGSAHWRNKADNGIVIHRNLAFDAAGVVTDLATSSVVVQKIRFREVGRIGSTELQFDTIAGRFSDSDVRRTA